MTPVVPELRGLPTGLILDGELGAWRKSEPYFPLVCRHVLNRHMSMPLTFVIFDLLRQKGVDLTTRPYSERRRELDRLKLDCSAWTTSETFDDGRALFSAVCELGFEGVSRRTTRASIARTIGGG
jgi:bifunctional non-homologous end joining protein LigD